MNARNMIKSKTIFVLCLLLSLGLYSSETKGQNNIYRMFVKSEWIKYYDTLNLNYGSKKKFVKEFELQSLIALSYYPELKDVTITFRYHDIMTTMEVRPEYFSMLKSSHRKYIISIDTNTHNEGVLLKEVSFNAQVGVIGHELAHIIDFERRSVKSLFLLGFNYMILNNHAKYERSIDELTIQRGLGWQSLEFADFMQYKSKASVRYKKFKMMNYLSDIEIESEIAKMNMYSSFKGSGKLDISASEKQ